MMVLSQKTYQITDDVRLFFTDSGAPPDSTDYTTIVAVHGFGFSGVCFEKLQSQAHAYNLRVVALNRRDYAGSTPFSDDELDALKGGDDTRARGSIERLGLHIALFLRKFVEEEGVPSVTNAGNGRKRGGLAVMGWSMGALTAIAPFANPNALGEETYGVLKGYIRDLILYDPPFIVLGLPIPTSINPEKLHFPHAPPNVKHREPQEIFENFVRFVGSRYQYEIRDGVATPASIEESGSLPRTEQCVMDLWSRDEFERLTDVAASMGADMLLLGWQGLLNETTQKVLFDEKVAKTFFPELKITHFSAPHSFWMTGVACMEIRRMYREKEAVVRPIEFVELEGADHFVHYTDPESLLKVVKGVVT
ncbi:hypothetical protein V5O48_018520 [Marasmius crinis-equi]|uniref:AB hydrolase-1 domain-containing protein n=1 Tax=Marasmius crinis-equi TaxID=585013 RepID=A0ABR3EKY4_9AGAR